MTTDTSGTPLTGLSEAGAMMSGFLSDDLTVDDTGAAPQKIQAQDEEPEADEAEGSKASPSPDETASDDDAGEGAREGSEEDQEDDEAEPSDEEQEDADKAAPQTVTVKIDGKDVEVPLEEAVRGYQRQADYSRKTQALSDDRKAFDALRVEHSREVETVSQERGRYKVLLDQLQTALTQLVPQEPNWEELFARDKNEYLIARDNWRALQEQKAAVAAEADRVAQQERAETTTALGRRIAEGQAKLLEWEPKWKDVAVRHKDFQAAMTYARDRLGYTDADIANANDHRSIYAIYKAMQFDALKAEAANVGRQAVKKGTKVLKPGGQAAAPVQASKRAHSDGMKRLVKGGGRVEDAASILANMMD